MRKLRHLVWLALLKAVWVASCLPTDRPAANDASALGNDSADVRARWTYLRDRHLDGDFYGSSVASPGGIFDGEWRIVSLSMTAAATANLVIAGQLDRAEALPVLDALVATAKSPAARAFDTRMWGEDALTSLDSPHGHVGYLGHLAFMMSARLRVAPDEAIHDELTGITAALARRMANAPSRHIETYPGECYTADNSVAVAALATFEAPTHAAVIAEWVAYTRTHLLDPDGIIVFGLDDAQRPSGLGRGSAAGYNSFYLPLIDTDLARQQRHAMQQLRVDVGSARAFRERPHGFGIGDVDSGPLIFGLSPAATGFSIAGARHANDPALFDGLLLTAELAGFTVPTDLHGGRCYLLAPLVGDAIVLAMRTATPWPANAN